MLKPQVRCEPTFREFVAGVLTEFVHADAGHGVALEAQLLDVTREIDRCPTEALVVGEAIPENFAKPSDFES